MNRAFGGRALLWVSRAHIPSIRFEPEDAGGNNQVCFAERAGVDSDERVINVRVDLLESMNSGFVIVRTLRCLAESPLHTPDPHAKRAVFLS